MVWFRFRHLYLTSRTAPLLISTKQDTLPKNWNAYLKSVAAGETLLIALDNKIVARLMPETDPAEAAYLRILSYRKDAWVGDVLSEANEIWEQNS